MLNTVFSLPSHNQKFPGSLPVSMSGAMLTSVLPYGYVASAKADGIRVFVIVSSGQPILLINRANNITTLHNHVVTRVDEQCLCVFDAEMVLVDNDYQLFLFDTLVYRCINVTGLCYSVRHELATGAVHDGLGLENMRVDRKHVISKNLCIPSRYEAGLAMRRQGLFVMAKPIHTLNQLKQLWPNKKLPFDVDGIIFTKLRHIYMSFRSSPLSVIKYKPPQDITIDFCAADVKEKRVQGLHGVDEKLTVKCKPPNSAGHVVALLTMYGNVFAIAQSTRAVTPGTIVECCFVSKQNTNEFYWHVVRERVDKTKPNNDVTIFRTCDNILDGLTEEELFGAF